MIFHQFNQTTIQLPATLPSRFAYTMIGHDLRPLETPFGEQHLIRMIRWAAGAKE
ncbi:hypothetical protein ADIS_0258 [Lunatimonas lonarensis]|uniref:Uncharacterized protein n=1 Tax=Lunatimonas lonarensis TaxID=1232681 RepID=R7ZYX7_9BACT|nr:hypothetical protein [Lunatimonas lonarensis]EON79253.1 hypothetical protein ADIS_0258 [Lunatimonas lonarensis]